ncbi:hypothetical protein T265_00724 [Opisthorchis viverrini]|uniref:Uncharacterized protein n=1 Tax=Opisthorchis viverrini TaxID=6198 RepID=A0A075A108_OPIVI|nr:hypothetical protein T265_00724 [Opisthorchis viverrini]KER33413.1 hypothetical protein T265_00724 [Opisthorchis viverrini]
MIETRISCRSKTRGSHLELVSDREKNTLECTNLLDAFGLPMKDILCTVLHYKCSSSHYFMQASPEEGIPLFDYGFGEQLSNFSRSENISGSMQLNVLYQAASCLSRYDIRDIAIHIYLCDLAPEVDLGQKYRPSASTRKHCNMSQKASRQSENATMVHIH